MPVSAAITFRMAMGSGYVAVMRGTPVTPFLIRETHRRQQVTPAFTLPQVRYGLSLLLLEVFCTPGVDSICRQVQRQLLRNESARFYHHRTRKCIPPRKLRRDIQ
jgi:hypothetical protein